MKTFSIASDNIPSDNESFSSSESAEIESCEIEKNINQVNYSIQQPSVIGEIDSLTRDRITGWFCVSNATFKNVRTRIYVDSILTKMCFQPDGICANLSVHGKSECLLFGKPGFSYKFPKMLNVGQSVIIQIMVTYTAGYFLLVDFPYKNNALNWKTIEGQKNENVQLRPLQQHRRELKIRQNVSEPIRLNILMCGVTHALTGGPLSILRFAVLASRYGFNVRYINIDGGGIDYTTMMKHMKQYNLLKNFENEIELVWNAHGGSETLSVNPNDLFMGTVYFTALIASFTARHLNNPNIIYFIQDYEPIFFPHDSNWLEAHETYRIPHFPIFSTPFLRTYFEYRKESIFRECVKSACDEQSWTAMPAIKSHTTKQHNRLQQKRRIRRVVVYARPQAPRNAFDLTIYSLSEAVGRGVFMKEDEWEFLGIGADSDVLDFCNLGNRSNVCLHMIRNIPEPEYLKLLSTADIGYSLMVSPHPSLPPLDFAAAGLITVTNSFETKTAESFKKVSKNIIVAEPYLDSLVEGLRKAVSLCDDIESRMKNSKLNWPTEWNDERCYGPPLFERLKLWFKYRKPIF
ncbi:unnamed protein product [Rotaria magnacalcarata]|uniref:Glycosyltransferase n=2 Tax=Rotaria magnacalcarata TaxID=392030 RepID=A0A819XIK4_9BILA|nr:unnamed protein product [Rotaria magnacalcarata]CAF4136342.1 unnamed protein product [Rotaria magnacalcarata]